MLTSESLHHCLLFWSEHFRSIFTHNAQTQHMLSFLFLSMLTSELPLDAKFVLWVTITSVFC